MAHEVAVMYTGQIVERGTVFQVLKEPKHPYTLGLLNSIPGEELKGSKLNVIRGTVPNPLELPKGCTFAPRCPYVMDICRKQEPRMVEVAAGQWAHCWLYQSANGTVQKPMNLPTWNEASEAYDRRNATTTANAPAVEAR
jgi:oligopeptide/dipeptide ABC transporter ATP-binding protein